MNPFIQTILTALTGKPKSPWIKERKPLTLQDGPYTLPTISRVEVIDRNGRSYVSGTGAKNVEVYIQDGGRTLKVFLGRDQ